MRYYIEDEISETHIYEIEADSKAEAMELFYLGGGILIDRYHSSNTDIVEDYNELE